MPPTSDGLWVGGEHKQPDEAQTERGVVVLPDDHGDEEHFPVAGQQQGSEEQPELNCPTLQTSHPPPKEPQCAAAERQQLCNNQ